MSAIEPLFNLLGIDANKLTKQERVLLEAELFLRICNALKEEQRNMHKDYFRLMKYTKEKEDEMLDNDFIRLLIKDILSTDHYTVPGIAYYTYTDTEMVEQIYQGRCTNPSAYFLRRLIELHHYVRRNLYVSIVQKLLTPTDAS